MITTQDGANLIAHYIYKLKTNYMKKAFAYREAETSGKTSPKIWSCYANFNFFLSFL
jgi:hypothetical protein